MRKKLFAAILLLLVLNDNTFTNNEQREITKDNTKMSVVLKHALKEFEKNSQTASLIEKYKLKGDYNDDAISKIRKIAFKLNIKEEWLYQLFYLESRGNPQAVNKQQGDSNDPEERVKLGRAVGLIQFLPSTAKHLGTSTEDLYKMTVSQQCDWVEKYLLNVKNNRKIKFNNFEDLYFAVFYHSAINQSDNYIIGESVSEAYAMKVAKMNRGIDKTGDNNGLLSVSDVKSWINKCLPQV